MDYHNQVLHDRVIQLSLIHMTVVITLQQFCDPFPFVQFVSYAKKALSPVKCVFVPRLFVQPKPGKIGS